MSLNVIIISEHFYSVGVLACHIGTFKETFSQTFSEINIVTKKNH